MPVPATLISVADVQDALPGVQIDASSVPSDTQVTGYCVRIEADVRARYEACSAGAWPVDYTSNTASFLRQTVLEGVKAETLRAKFALTSDLNASPEGKRSLDEYNNRLKDICQIARAAMGAETVAASGPAVASPKHRIPFALDFAEASEVRDVVSQIELGRRVGRGGLPWPF